MGVTPEVYYNQSNLVKKSKYNIKKENVCGKHRQKSMTLTIILEEKKGVTPKAVCEKKKKNNEYV